MPMAKEATEETSPMVVVMVLLADRLTVRGCSEWLPLGVLVGILLPVVHLLPEGLCLLLICKRQAYQTLLDLEGVEEGSVLVVLEGIVDLLVPDHPAIGRL